MVVLLVIELGEPVNKFLKENTTLILVSWGHFVNDFYMSIVPFVLYVFAIELDLTATQMSMIAFVITTAGTFFQPLVGLLIDRVQKSILLIYALIVISVGMSLSGLITNVYLLTVVVGVAALGSSVYHPLGSTITIHKTGLTRGKSLSIFMTVGGFAHTAAPIVAIPLVTYFGLKSLVYLMIPGLVTAALLYLNKVQKVSWTKENKDKTRKSKKILTAKQQLQLTIPMTIAVIKGVLYRVTVVFGIIIMVMRGVDTVLAEMAIPGFMFARATSTFIGGFVSDSIGEKNTLILFNIGTLLAVLLFAFGSGVSIIIGVILLGFTINGSAAANITITHKIVPENVNYGTGLIMGFAATLSAVAMLGYGALVDVYSHLIVINVLVGLAILMSVLSFLIPKEY